MKNLKDKDNLEFWNSISWFLMDAMWMFANIELSLALGIPTIISGIAIIFHNKKIEGVSIDFSMLMWMLMNISWLISEEFKIPSLLFSAKIFFMIGIVALAFAAIKSDEGIDLIFKRFRRYKRPSY